MKKVFLSLLAIVYMTVSSGMAMEIHFCMGERTGTDFYANFGDTCGLCGMKEKKGGCCSDEHKFIKLSDDHKTSSVQYIDQVTFILPHLARHLFIRHLIPFSKETFRTATYADSGPPLYLSNCVFRI